jgi:hypothetical protein
VAIDLNAYIVIGKQIERIRVDAIEFNALGLFERRNGRWLVGDDRFQADCH